MKSRSKRWVQTSCMLAALVIGATVATASLQRKSPIEPEAVQTAIIEQDSFQQTLTQVNEHLALQASESGLSVAPRAENLAIARRLSLALVGSGLALEEIRALEQVPESQQIQWWTAYLLADRRWADYFSERLTRAYVGVDQGPFILFRRRRFQQWLADQLHEGLPYDRLVRAMLTADGLWTDTPQVNFITATIEDGRRADPMRLSGRTARVFLGQRIDCLQCHDDFLGDLNFGSSELPVAGTQQHFHGLAAFFSGTTLSETVFQGIREDGQAYRYQYLGEDHAQQVNAAVPFADELLPAEGKPRQRLADWVTHPNNKAFSRATVNRIWALMLSRPLVEPVDSIPLDENVPRSLDVLAEDFAQHGFDVRRLISIIAHSDAFQRASRADFEITEKHEQHWAVFPLSQLRPEQVAYSVFQAARLSAIDDSSSIFVQLKSFGDLKSFLKQFGDRGEDEFEDDAVTIQQRLIMMNGEMVQERTKVDLVNNAGTRIATLVSDDALAIELVFLSALNRRPSPSEVATFLQHLNGKRGDDRSRGVDDVYWAIFNSTEFSWNH